MEIFEPEATGRNSVARERKELPEIGWCQNNRNFGGLQPYILIFPSRAPKGPFWPFFGPQGVWGRSENANLAATQKLLVKMGPTQLDY